MRLCFTALIICAALSGCDSDPDRTAAALAILGGGLQNYGAARASYMPPPQSVYCYPVGRGMMCN